MKKLFDKDQVWFAVVWIIIYVVGFANMDSLSEAMGVPKLLTVVFGLAASAILYAFIRRHALSQYLGLCRMKISWSGCLWLVPLAVISSVNFWNGVRVNAPAVETLLYIISMFFVGFLEEVIFRGLLFKGMCKSNVRAAIIVSSLTFGVGHIVNLLLGEPLFDTLLQLVYASAIGFCYTALFHAGDSILPCIISHALVNSTSIFAVEPDARMHIIITIIQTAICLAYGAYLLRRNGRVKEKAI